MGFANFTITNDDNEYLTPVGRHRLETFEHFQLFCAHDISAFSTILFFIFLWNVKKTNPLHKWIGRLIAIPLITAVVTGFKLIYYRNPNQLEHNIISMDVGRVTLSTQGYCVIGLVINGFIFKRWINDLWLNRMLVCFHIFNIYCGFHSFKFLLENFMSWNGYNKPMIGREISLELLIALTIPQILIDAMFLIIHSRIAFIPTLLEKIDWKMHHEMCVIAMMYICCVGLLFNIAHDKYYLFAEPGITDIRIRIAIILAPIAILAARRFDRVIGTLLLVLSDQSKPLKVKEV